MKLLIAYGTTEGQTRKICEFLRDEAQQAGHWVSIADTTGPQLRPSGFDAAIIAASVHYGNYQASVEHYVTDNHELLNHIPSTFLSVSLTAASDEPESWKELNNITESFLDRTHWNPDVVEQVAGALLYSKYNFFKKFIMRLIAQRSGGGTDTSEDYEYTDWDQVKQVITKLETAAKTREQIT